MNEKRQQQLNDLDAHIKTLQATGDRAGQAAAHTQKAILYALSFDLASVSQEMARAGVLSQTEGSVEALALTYYQQGKNLANYPDQKPQAQKLLKDAAALFYALQDPYHEAESLKILAALYTPQNMAQANKYLDKAIASLNIAIENPSSPEANPTTKVTITTLLTELLLIQSYYQANQANPPATPANLPNWANASITPDTGLPPAAYRSAFKKAETIRQTALNSDSLTRHIDYLSASLTMAGLAEHLGDRRRVLYALLTAKAYLQENFQPAIGQQIDHILDAYKEKWGETTTQQAIQDYQQWLYQQAARRNQIQS